MTDTEIKVTPINKYWIKVGSEVVHRDHPGRKMYVDRIVRQSRNIKEGDYSKKHIFVLGIDCHWIDADGKYGSGRFLTMELIAYDHEQQ